MSKRTFTRPQQTRRTPQSLEATAARFLAGPTHARQPDTLGARQLTVAPAHNASERAAEQAAAAAIPAAGHSFGQLSPHPVGNEGGTVNSATAGSIERARSGGRPLPEGTRAPIEQALSHDFSQVRIHADPQADALSRQLSARAFTTGNDIFFRKGAYAPSSAAGRRLLAHELTHVAQQSGDAGAGLVQRAFAPDNVDWSEAISVRAIRAGAANKGVFVLSNQAGESLVTKFTDENVSGAQSFGDKVMSIVGLESPDSVPVASGDARFAQAIGAINSAIQAMRARGGAEVAVADDAENLLQSKGAAGAKNMLLMRQVSGVDMVNQLIAQSPTATTGERAGAEESGGDPMFNVIEFYKNPEFLKNLGRMAVGDAFVGNQDRLAVVIQKQKLETTYNSQNFKVDQSTGGLGSFDQDVRLYSRDFFAQKSQELGQDGSGDAWFNMLMQGENYQNSIMERPAPSLGAIFTEAGQRALYKQIVIEVKPFLGQDLRPIFEQEFTFDLFRANFLIGMRDAVIAIAANADVLRKAAMQLQDDKTLDPEAVEVRLAFMEQKASEAKGKREDQLGEAMEDNTTAIMSAQMVSSFQEQARRSREELAIAQALSRGEKLNPSQDLLTVAQKPGEESGLKKFKRGITRGGQSEKSKHAKLLREQIQGETLPDDMMDNLDTYLNSIQGGDRRSDKARFHVQVLKVVKAMQDSLPDIDHYLQLVTSPNLSRAPKDHLQAQKDTINKHIKDAKAAYANIYKSYGDQLQSKKDKAQADRLAVAYRNLNQRMNDLQYALRLI